MRLAFILILLFSVIVTNAQRFAYPAVVLKSKQLTDFIPVGWMILDSVTRDLNNDNTSDAVLVLQHYDSVMLVNNEQDTVISQPRILVIVFKNQQTGNFERVEQSNSFILSHDNPSMDEPYYGMSISKQVLEIRFNIFYSMGSWYVTNAKYRFRYKEENFELIGAEHYSFHRATQEYERYSYNFLTKKRSITVGNAKDETGKTKWGTIKLSAPKTLKTFQTPFTWQVEKEVLL